MRSPPPAATAAVAVVCFCVGFWAEEASTHLGSSVWPTTTSLDVVQLEITTFNEYTRKNPVYSPHWKSVVEPFRDTTLQVYDPSGGQEDDTVEYMWHVSNQELGPGRTVQFVFKELGRHDIEVTKVERQLDGSHRPIAMEKIQASCKYVRREIRSLTDKDRDLFLDTVVVLQNVPTEEGSIIWGSKFKDKDYFVRLHLLYGADPECDHWHEGTGFVTSHMALTLEYEQSLQSVHPTITVPYWDFTLESTFYNEENWRTSMVFNPDWFGSAAPANDLHTIDKGRFAFVPTRAASWNYSTYVNSYGLLRAPWNNDPSPFLTRHDHVVGYYNNLKPRGCDGFAKCMEYDTWVGVAKCLNTDAHGHIHELIGGSWSFRQQINETAALGAEIMPNTLDFVHLTQALSKELWRNRYLTCPKMCSSNTPVEDCACTCDAEILKQDPYETLHSAEVLSLLNFFDTENERITTWFNEESNRTEYKLIGKPEEHEKRIWKLLLENLCDPGHIGDMYQASSPNDIIFWVLHPTLDRLWHWIRLSADHTSFDDSWEDDPSVCHGHNPSDLQPWTNELFGLEGTEMLTNQQLYEYMNPGSDVIPYIYDDYSWPHCTFMGYDMTYRGTEDSYSIEGFL